MATTRDRSDVFGQLLADVSKLWRHRLNVELKPLGLNCTLRSLLQELVDVGEGLMQRELAQRLGIESATLVGLVDTLSNAGWVERQVSTKDRRRKTVHLTRSGRRVLARSEDVIGKLRREMLNAIASKDLEVCIRVFRTMLEPHVATDASRSASSAVSSPPPRP